MKVWSHEKEFYDLNEKKEDTRPSPPTISFNWKKTAFIVNGSFHELFLSSSMRAIERLQFQALELKGKKVKC